MRAKRPECTWTRRGGGGRGNGEAPSGSACTASGAGVCWARIPARRRGGRLDCLTRHRLEEDPMQAVVLHETGDPDVLRLEQADRPEPGDDEVLIKVHAASVNPIDWKYRRGLAPKQLPAVLGNDVSGTVEVSRAESFAEGEEV